jgi:DNA polymerase phi
MIAKCLEMLPVDSPEWLYFIMEAQSLKVELDWVLEGFAKPKLLHFKNLKRFCSILKLAPYPEGIIHPIFESLIKILLNSQEKKFFTISCFWNEMDSCFLETHERKFLCFQILQLMLPSLTHLHIPLILTPKFLKCYINTLSNKNTLLYAQARNITKSLISVSKDPKVGLGIVSVLMERKLYSFDAVTKTKMVEDILSSLDLESIQEYASQLINMSMEAINENVTKWSVEQLSLLIRNGGIIKHENYIRAILNHFVKFGFFENGLSNSTTSFFREKLLSILGYLMNTSLGSKRDLTKNKEELRKIALESRKTRGKLQDGSTWFDYVLETLLKLKNDGILIKKGSEQVQDGIKVLIKNLEQLSKLDKNSENESMRMLMAYTLIELHQDNSDLFQDLSEIFKQIYNNPVTLKRKKSKEALGVLVDILLSMLSKDSSTVRHVAMEVFGAFLAKFDKDGIDLMFGVIEASEGNVGHDELFEEIEGEDDGSDSEDNESEASDEVSEMETEVDVVSQNDILHDVITKAMKEKIEDEDKLPDLDDDEMTAFDTHLSQIFSQKKQIGKEQKITKITVQHFKLRVLDIVDEFVTHNHEIIHILQKLLPIYETTVSKDNLAINQKVSGILRRICKSKMDIDDNDKESIKLLGELLLGIHSKLRKCSLNMTQVYNSLSLFISKNIFDYALDAKRMVCFPFNI